MVSSDAPVAATAHVTTSTRPVRVVVVRPDERVEQVAARHRGAAPSFNRTLRVALAMRGGVSLSAWVGGAVAELDLLRRIRLYDAGAETLAFVPETPASPLTPAVLARLQAYAEMLDATGYDRVEVDLLAGAGAGGLLAVVYAVAQRAGTGLERLLDTWTRVGGLWELLHPPGARRILGLTQGEDSVRAHASEALRDIHDTDDRHPDLVSDHTSVDLSATVVDADDEPDEDAGEPGQGDDLANLVRLALAARPASSPTGTVFDDLPIDRALRAARSRGSDRRADRVMLVLGAQPDAPLSGMITRHEHASRLLRAIGALLSRRLRRESVANEVADLERFDADQLASAARFDSAAPLIGAASWSHPAISERQDAYVRALGTSLADHLVEAVSAPGVWQRHSMLATRREYRSIERIALGGLGAACARRFAQLPATDVSLLARSPLALSDAAECVLGWTRALESFPEEAGSRRAMAFPEVRRAAYDALTAAIRWRDELTDTVLRSADRVARSGVAPTAEDFDRWIDEWLRTASRIRTSSHWRDLDMGVARLRIVSSGAERDAKASRRALPDAWTGSAWRPLASAPGSLSAIDLPPLYRAIGIPAALSHVRTWTVDADEEPDDPASFRTLAADRWYAVLGREMRRPRATPDDVAAAVDAASDRVVLDRQSKLAGYGDGDSLGFLARDWRVNDWWWGRLDATAGLARFLGSLAPTAVQTGPAVRLLQDAVLEEADDPGVTDRGLSPLEAAPPTPPDPTAQRAARRVRLRAGTDTILDLSPSYRFAIASRAVRLLDRVVVQPARRALGALAGTVLALLRPVLVTLPAAADPPRLALVAGVVAGVAWLLTWSPITPPSAGWLAAVAIIALALAAMVVVGVRATRTRWARVAQALDEPLDRFARAAAERAWRPTLRLTLLTLASLVPLAVALLQANMLLVLLCLGVTGVLTAITLRVASSVQRTSVPGRGLRTGLMIGVFAVFGGLLPLVQLIFASPGDWLAPPPSWNPWVLAAGAAVVTIVLTADWLRIGRSPRAIALTRGINWIAVTLLSVAAGLAGYAVASMLTTGVEPLVAENLCAAAFVLAWANALWWLPGLAKATPDVPDRVQRAPLEAAELGGAGATELGGADATVADAGAAPALEAVSAE